MLTSIVILQILIKTKGELGEANRAASKFECITTSNFGDFFVEFFVILNISVD